MTNTTAAPAPEGVASIPLDSEQGHKLDKVKKTDREPTRYVVLTTGSGDDWLVVNTVPATNTDAAIKTVADDHGEGVYVAVPERSWKPATVTKETKTTLKLNTA